MTASGLLDQLVSLLPSRAAPPSAIKAERGSGSRYYADGGIPIGSAVDDPLGSMRKAQDVYISNRHVRKAERLISQRFATVGWHLEDGSDEDVTDASPAPYLAIRDLIEKPYTPLPGDPITATPRTRADLWGLTCRHMGVCGMGYWYLDQTEALGGLPLQILYINPARLAPALNGNAQLVGWVLDPDSRSGGVPLEVANVLPFYLEPPDRGFLAQGLVASAMSMVQLTRVADRHANGVLSAGGRLSGVFSPKGDGFIEQEVFDQLVLDLRNAAESPDSARRMNILRGPVEFNRLSATPAELDLVAVMNLSRDEVTELWGVPRSQMGGTTPVGLNGGDSKAYDEAVLWQNAVGPRLRSFAETLQYGLLDRYATAGVVVELEIEEPEFDDDSPMYLRAEKAVPLPLRNIERRELVGLAPFGDERDEEVWLPSTQVRVYPEAVPGPVPPQLAPFTGMPPQPSPAPAGAPMPMPGDVPAGAPPVKAGALDDLRASMRRAVLDVLDRYGRAVAAKVRERGDHLARKPGDVAAVLDETRLERDLLDALTPIYGRVMAEAGAGAQRHLHAGKADLRQAAVDRLLQAAGVRIKGIGETTRLRVADIVRQGIADGLSAAELGDRIEAASDVFGELRAETIARTETATVLNQAAVAQFADFGVDTVQVVDGDGDEVCAAADGQVWTLDQAAADPIGHPNCVRTFTPIVGAPA